MAARIMAFCLALFGLTVTAIAQTTAIPEMWVPINPIAKATTGRVTFTPSEMTFQDGQSLSLARGGQMLFRPEPKQRHIMADLYRVTSQDDADNRLCKGKPTAFLIIWKPEKISKEAAPRGLAPFSGPKLNAGSADDCGRYLYSLMP